MSEQDESKLEIRLLGQLELSWRGELLAPLKSRKTRALFAYLLLVGRPLVRERLSRLLWENSEDPKAALRWSLSRLRTLANVGGIERLRSEGNTVAFDCSDCDVDWFALKAAAENNFAGHSPAELKQRCEQFDQRLLGDLDLPECGEYQDWVTAQRREAEEVHALIQRVCRKLGAGPTGPRPAVAVLPFKNLSTAPEDEYFADGLSEDLITALSLWRSFPVIARSSSFTYKGQNARVQEIGVGLGARYVLDGSVRRAGDRIRVTATLTDAESGYELWAEKIDRQLADVFAVQDEITERVAHAIAPKLQQAEWSRVAAKRTRDLTAWDFYIRGMELFHQEERSTNHQAREMFDRAAEHDPDYAEAWARLAWTFIRDIDLRATDDRESTLARAFELSRHAISIDDESAVAHLCLGTAHIWNEEFEPGLAAAKRALEINPNYAHAAMAVGNRLDLIGETERGIEQMEASLKLNPRDPNRWHYLGYLARAYTVAGEHDAAVDWAERAAALRPNDAEVQLRLALCLANLDRVDEARSTLERCESLEPGFLRQRAEWAPYRDEARNRVLFAGARKNQLLFSR